MSQTSFYTNYELLKLGFKTIGNNVLISKKSSLYDIRNIEIGSNVRIDDFCILSGNITLGSFIHISAYTAIYGAFGVEMEDYSGLSPRCTIFSATDDFSGDYLIGPMVNKEFTNVINGKVHIKKYCQIGAGSIILPGVTIDEGACVGSMSFVNKDLDPWKIYVGIPIKMLKERKKSLLKFIQ